MERVSQYIYDEMLEMGLLKPNIKLDVNGKVIRIKDKETGRFKKVVDKKVQVVNKNKSSRAKTYYVEKPEYEKYLEMKSKNISEGN